MIDKPSFDSIFMNLASDLAKRSHCVKAQVGAVLTKDTRIISIGYNGPRELITVISNGLIAAVRGMLEVAAHLHCMPKKMLFFMR
jgi:deoxycytidylate deaminase